MTFHRPTYADAKTTLETEILSLRRRLARAHRILTAGEIGRLQRDMSAHAFLVRTRC